MDNKKIKLGQFFTRNPLWIKPQIANFIRNSNCTIAYDPFAGGGHLLKAAQDILDIENIVGLDIDESLSWKKNDSLISIPHLDDAIIITNPPYIAKQSASRKNINLLKYFATTTYNDIYLLALDKMIEAQKYIVAIIPESFINSSFRRKDLLYSITVLEENPFCDTENPVCVACFDCEPKNEDEIRVYKNDKIVGTIKSINDARIAPKNNISITFNSLIGWLGLRAIDSTNDKTVIKFDFKENIKYDWEHRIKVSSRHFSLIDINVPDELRQLFVNRCNERLSDIRIKSSDILLTPFKGDTRSGMRRRRLDFKLARAIMEKVYDEVIAKGGLE